MYYVSLSQEYRPQQQQQQQQRAVHLRTRGIFKQKHHNDDLFINLRSCQQHKATCLRIDVVNWEITKVAARSQFICRMPTKGIENICMVVQCITCAIYYDMFCCVAFPSLFSSLFSFVLILVYLRFLWIKLHDMRFSVAICAVTWRAASQVQIMTRLPRLPNHEQGYFFASFKYGFWEIKTRSIVRIYKGCVVFPQTPNRLRGVLPFLTVDVLQLVSKANDNRYSP